VKKPTKRPPKRPLGAPGPALHFRNAFDTLWTKLFTSPVHLDSALSHAPPSTKAPLATVTRALLQRPRSLAYYLRFELHDEEPFGLDAESLAHWPVARAMAKRLYQSYKKDHAFTEEGYPVEADFPADMIEEWKREFGKRTSDELVVALGSPAPLSCRASRTKGRDATLSALNDSKELPRRGRI
jgi:hypothetical protein